MLKAVNLQLCITLCEMSNEISRYINVYVVQFLVCFFINCKVISLLYMIIMSLKKQSKINLALRRNFHYIFDGERDKGQLSLDKLKIVWK